MNSPSKEKILLIGSGGQVGSELTASLQQHYGVENVIASDIKAPAAQDGIFELLDVQDTARVAELADRYKITQIYLLAAVLSATAEKNVKRSWQINVDAMLGVLDLAVEKKISKIFWPSSIAVFGPNSPKINTPQYTVTDPATVYGISKLTGERWVEYYFQKHGLDIRSLRYPGIISYKAAPGGGTTDYAVHIFYEALQKGLYNCFLNADTILPMIYMPDVVHATIALMEAPAEKISIRSGYNLAGVSFSPAEIAAEIQKHIPLFICKFTPDMRQQIAESWPQSIDDSFARKDWGWQPQYMLPEIVNDMIFNIRKQN